MKPEASKGEKGQMTEACTKQRCPLLPPPTKDPEVSALPIGACRVGCQAEVVAHVLGQDWLDLQRTIWKNLQSRWGEGYLCDGLDPWKHLVCPSQSPFSQQEGNSLESQPWQGHSDVCLKG